MDHHVGALLRGLAEIGRYDDALIIVVSDHGELFGEHGQTRHGPYLYEELLRVALLVRLPGGRGAGSSVEAPVSVVDLLPLIAAEVGFVLPPGVEGVMPGERSLVLAESRPNGFDLRKHGAAVDRELTVAIEWPWKLISGSRGERELYHLERDAAEARNLAGDPREARLFERLERARAAFRAPSTPAAPTDVAPQTEENLRRLGYIE
jgi:arylsulfatase A-like enzyme